MLHFAGRSARDRRLRVTFRGANMSARAIQNSTPLTRRQLLQVGSVGMLGLALPDLLRAGSQRSGEKSCIFIVQYGGASHIDSLDPKPDAPADVRGPYRPIATAVPGLRLGELLPRLARMADRCTIGRSMTHRNG